MSITGRHTSVEHYTLTCKPLNLQVVNFFLTFSPLPPSLTLSFPLFFPSLSSTSLPPLSQFRCDRRSIFNNNIVTDQRCMGIEILGLSGMGIEVWDYGNGNILCLGTSSELWSKDGDGVCSVSIQCCEYVVSTSCYIHQGSRKSCKLRGGG